MRAVIPVGETGDLDCAAQGVSEPTGLDAMLAAEGPQPLLGAGSVAAFFDPLQEPEAAFVLRMPTYPHFGIAPGRLVVIFDQVKPGQPLKGVWGKSVGLP